MVEILQIIEDYSTLILAGVVAILAYKHNKLTHEISNDNLQKQLFSELNKRYDSLNDILMYICNFSNDDITRYNKASSEEKFGQFTKQQIQFKINDYFNLCSEEFYWYSKKRIDDRIWNSWCKGMNSVYKKSIIIQEQWEDEIRDDGWKTYYMNKPTDLFNKINL